MTGTKGYHLTYMIAVWGLLYGSLGLNIPNATAATSGKQLLTQADFKYLGAFAMPDNAPKGDAMFSMGLTLRYVNGELHMLSAAHAGPQDVYEVRVPALSTKAPFPQAQIVKDWGEITGGKAYTANGDFYINGLYWDEADKRLYWSYGSPYNATDGDDPAVGYSTLNDATGTATPVGVWRFTGRGCKATQGCVMQIPQWFADANTGGKRLGAGCGGGYSVWTVGPAHLGPALAAFSPPNPAVNPDRSSLPFTTLVGYPFSETIYGPPDRAHRNTDYNGSQGTLLWNPRNGIGYWTEVDLLYSAGVWIDLPDKTGLLFFPIMGNGRVWYEASTDHAERGSHWWYVYDPADLAKVAQGQKQQWEIQAAATWQVQYPGLQYPLGGWSNVAPYIITGAAYDDTTRRLYVAVRFGDPEYGLYGVIKVHVYEVQVNATSDSTPPAAPSGLRMK